MTFQKLLIGVCCLLPGLGWADDDCVDNVMGDDARKAACAEAPPQENPLISGMKRLNYAPDVQSLLCDREGGWLTPAHLMPLKQLLSRFEANPFKREGFLEALEGDALTPHELSILACLTMGDEERHLFVTHFRALGEERIVSLHQLVAQRGLPPYKKIPLECVKACMDGAKDVSPVILSAFVFSSVASEALPSAMRLLAFCENAQEAPVISHFFSPLLWLYPAYDALLIARDLTHEHIAWAKTHFPKDKDGRDAWHLALAARDQICDENVSAFQVLFLSNTLDALKAALFEKEVARAQECPTPTTCATF